MNKFDRTNNDLLMRIVDAESRHPKAQELPTHRFPAWSQPAVSFNGQAGVAVGWTANYGLVQFVDSDGKDRLEWIPAGLVKRLETE